MNKMSWKIRKRVLESAGFSIKFFCGNPKYSCGLNLYGVYLFWKTGE